MKTMKLIAALLMLSWAAYAADTASVSGKVTFDGTAPKPKKIKTDAEPQCAAMHVTPHCSGSSVESTVESKMRGARHAVDVLLGRWPPHVVNPEVVPRFALQSPAD